MVGIDKQLLTSQSAEGSRADPKLTPKLERARSKLLNGLGDVSLTEALVKLKAAIDVQKSEDARLANLSAQTWILRRRLEALQSGNLPRSLQALIGATPESSAKMKLMALVAPDAPEKQSDEGAEPSLTEPVNHDAAKSWRKVRVLSEAEVNGMIFFEGSVLAVKPEDAARLVEAGRAEVVEGAAAEAVSQAEKAKTAKKK